MIRCDASVSPSVAEAAAIPFPTAAVCCKSVGPASLNIARIAVFLAASPLIRRIKGSALTPIDAASRAPAAEPWDNDTQGACSLVFSIISLYIEPVSWAVDPTNDPIAARSAKGTVAGNVAPAVTAAPTAAPIVGTAPATRCVKNCAASSGFETSSQLLITGSYGAASTS
jgi:hypothetical protein